MKKLSLSLLSSFLVLILILLAGCASFAPSTSPSTSSTSNISPSTSTVTSSPTTTEAPLSKYFTLSRAPKLGETAELTFKIDSIRQLLGQSQPQEGLAKSEAWVDFYWTDIHGSYTEAGSSIQIQLEEVLVNGETSWEGNFNESRVNLHSIIQLPREGIWRIQWNFTGEGWSRNFEGSIWVAVADGTAAIMNANTEEFKNGPLGYLANFSYGFGGSQRIPILNEPFSLGLDISKAPKAGEEVTLSCRILSVIDIPDFSLQWRFYKRIGDSVQKIPSTDLLTSADLGWKTDIKKGEPVVFSTTIKFPAEGEWEILADGNYAEQNQYNNQDDLHITITSTRSYFGWAKLPAKPDSGTTITTPTQTHSP